jgi:hypothetical protein
MSKTKHKASSAATTPTSGKKYATSNRAVYKGVDKLPLGKGPMPQQYAARAMRIKMHASGVRKHPIGEKKAPPFKKLEKTGEVE